MDYESPLGFNYNPYPKDLLIPVDIFFDFFLASGQTCVAPDYLLCHESLVSRFQRELVKAFQRYGSQFLTLSS